MNPAVKAAEFQTETLPVLLVLSVFPVILTETQKDRVMPVTSFRHSPTGILARVVLVTRRPVHDLNEARVEAIDIEGNAFEIRERDIGVDALQMSETRDGVVYALPVEGARPFRYEADWETGEVEIEGVDGTMAIADFARQVIRTHPDGRPICSFLQEPHLQLEALRQAGDEAFSLHRYDLRAQVTAEREREETYSYRTGMYDIAVSDLDDGLSPLQAMADQARGANINNRHPVLQELGGDSASITRHPHWHMPAVRQVYRDFLAPYLGGTDVADTVVIQRQSEEAIAEMADLMSRKTWKLPPFKNDNLMPGYATSTPRLYEVGDLSVLVFSDMMSSYAYAWRPERRDDLSLVSGVSLQKGPAAVGAGRSMMDIFFPRDQNTPTPDQIDEVDNFTRMPDEDFDDDRGDEDPTDSWSPV